jgi:hypothetical protein
MGNQQAEQRLADWRDEDGEELRYRGVWRQVVFDRARELDTIREDLVAARVDHDDPCGIQDGGCVERLLQQARWAAARPLTPIAWWTGSLVERAWLALHQVEYHLVRHMPPAMAAEWWQRATGYRPGQHTPWKAEPGRLTEADSTAIALSLRAHHNAADRGHEQVRVFRNRLVVYALLGLTLLALLFVAVAWFGLTIPIDGGDVVSGVTQFSMVAIFGAIGAYIAGLPAVLTAEVRRSPYQLTGYQLALKLVVGPLFALLGILLVEEGLVPQMTAFGDFGPAVLVWAAIFGGSQQLVTGFLDRKATDVLGEEQRPREADEPIERVA